MAIADRLPLFPTPVPSENLYSLAARYARLVCSPSHLDTREVLFGVRHANLDTPFPPYLTHFYRVAGHRFWPDPVSMVESVTVAPLLKRFLDPDRYQCHLERALTANSPSASSGDSGRAMQPQRAPMLGFCIRCRDADYERLGFPIWRIEHQLPFVHACGIHGLRLTYACANCRRGFAPPHTLKLPPHRCDCGKLIDDAAPASASQVLVARFMMGLVAPTVEHLHAAERARAYKEKLVEMGQPAALSGVPAAIVARFRTFATNVASEAAKSNISMLLHTTFHTPLGMRKSEVIRKFHPLEPLFASWLYGGDATAFLSDCTRNLAANKIAPESSKPCGTRIAARLVQENASSGFVVRVARELKVSTTAVRYAAHRIGMACNDNAAPIDEDALARVLAGLRRESNAAVVARNLNMPLDHVYAIRTAYAEELKEMHGLDARRDRFRAKMQEMVSAGEGATRSLLRKRAGKAMDFLLKHDPSFLDDLVPSRRGQEGRGEPFRFVRIETERSILKSLDRLRAEVGRGARRRVTLTSISLAIGRSRTYLSSARKRMPAVAAVVDSLLSTKKSGGSFG